MEPATILAKAFIGGPLFGPGIAFGNALNGTALPPSSTTFTVQSEHGDFRIVFEGNFELTGGDISGGVVESYILFAGSTKVASASGYSLDAQVLHDAFQTNDYDLVDTLLFDNPVKLVGSKFDDEAYGSDFADKILGKDGNDWLDGRWGNDIIKGGKGNDAILGDDGFDVLYGGRGKDAFHFNFDSALPAESYDKIKDFTHGKDHVVLTDFNDVLPSGYLAKSNFHIGTEAKTADQVVIYDKKSGKVFYDADGTGAGDQFLLAKVGAGTKLHADDFFIGSPMLLN